MIKKYFLKLFSVWMLAKGRDGIYRATWYTLSFLISINPLPYLAHNY